MTMPGRIGKQKKCEDAVKWDFTSLVLIAAML